ncbi:hypothetical protein ACP70R_020435 [Stipagrostis hirtigluma subsp. patula]
MNESDSIVRYRQPVSNSETSSAHVIYKPWHAFLPCTVHPPISHRPSPSNIALACAASATPAEEAAERAMAAAAEDSAAAQHWWLFLLPVEQQQLPEPGVVRVLDHMLPPAVTSFFDALEGSGLRLADLTAVDVGRIFRQMVEAQRGSSSPLDGSSAPYRNGGFGAVPASAAAVAGLEKHAVRAAGGDGCGGGDDEGCAICLVDFEDGEEVSVMPCARGHEFHPGCIVDWLARSNMCPLCRHALPT